MPTTQPSLDRLRALAVGHTLFPATTLGDAIEQLGFVQADPIRAPARAQDLILRQRVSGYRAGDLERAYPELDLEEGMLYAYGFMPRALYACLHPRILPPTSDLEREVLKVARALQPVLASDLDEHFGSARVRNAWGGYSRATKRALESLHRRGSLRVVGRRKGVRIYGIAPRLRKTSAKRRLEKLARCVVGVFAPAPKASVSSILSRLGSALLDRGAGRRTLTELVRRGVLLEEVVDSVTYLLPADVSAPAEPPTRVRLLAPFDPLVHDRKRFEHLWGWAYRFEAYTPVAERVRGYYALPMLWRDRVVGWANLSHDGTCLSADVGFVRRRPREKAFRAELADELERVEAFLSARPPR